MKKLMMVIVCGCAICASAGVFRVDVLSSKMRKGDPTVMDIVYKVNSSNEFVDVRVLAFKDGFRSFCNVIRPETFIEGTEVNVGDHIAANVEHKISWRVSSDWKIDLSRVSFEVLARTGELLPLKLVTIPKSSTHGAMQVSRNIVPVSRIYDVLMWLYAAKDSALTLSNGNLLFGGKIIAYGRVIADDCYYCGNGGMIKYDAFPGYYDDWDNFYYIYHEVEEEYWEILCDMESGEITSAIDFVYGKMGFRPLVGEEMNYAIKMMRLDLRSCCCDWGAGYWPYAMRSL